MASELGCGQGHVVGWGGADHGQAGAELQGQAEEAGGGGHIRHGPHLSLGEAEAGAMAEGGTGAVGW